MSLASQIGFFGLQWAVGTCLVGGILKGALGGGWRIGASFVPLQHVTLGRRASVILLAVSAAIALAAVTLLHLAT
jgi:hypothetical protein